MTDAFKEYLNHAADIAFKDLAETGAYKQLSEQAKRVYAEWETMLRPDDRHYVEECIDILMEPGAMECSFYYLRGHTDCVKLLKALRVI